MKSKRGLKKRKGFGKIIDHEHYNRAKKRVGLALIILIIALVIFTVFFWVFYPKPCSDVNCFVNAMKNCKRVSWIREDEQASWLYVIKGNAEGDSCKIEVKLLKVKQGTIDSERLEGEKMICIQQKGDTQFPEKDIFHCTGALKEELQDLIIQRMYSYLLKNIGEIKQEFKTI